MMKGRRDMINIGVDIGGTKIAAGYLDEHGKLQAFKKVSTENVFALDDDPIQSLQIFINQYIDEIKIDRKLIGGIGVGVPSVLDSHTQEVVSTPNIPELNQVPLSRLLSPLLDLPVYVENDVNLIALGEHLHGRGQGISDLACVFVGTGLGCGLILNNKLYTGADGAAAEFGHMIYEPEGRLCGCGAKGCYESYCSGYGLTYDARQFFSESEIEAFSRNPKFSSFSLAAYLINSAKNGDKRAVEIIENSFHILGLALTSMVNLLNPRLVILGGGIINGWPEAIEIVRNVVYEKARAVSKQRLIIDTPALKDKGGLYGASELVRLNLEKK